MISGAGVLITSIIDNKLVFVLFEENNKYKTCSDLGGGRDKYEIPIETACRETFEESAGLLFLNKKTLKSGINNIINKYQSYCIKLDKLDNIINHFAHNRQIMKKCADSTYNEMRKIRMFDVDTLLLASKNNQHIIQDVTNQNRKIRDRTLNIINKLNKKDIEQLPLIKLNIKQLNLNNCFDGAFIYTDDKFK